MPKPLIEIEGKPIIAHVLAMYPGETDIIFICNEDHLGEPSYRMEEILRTLCTTGRIVGIPPHHLGPVHAVRQVEHLLDAKRPTIINYCDFTCYWDWNHFKSFVHSSACAGAIPAYKGFHPHLLGSTNYAYMREKDGWVTDIQEKKPYTDDRMQEYASSGTYYYASAALMSHALAAALEQSLTIGGEYYASLTYKPLLAEGKPVAVYPLQHFMQWGTPEDVAEYNGWSHAFHRLLCADNTVAPHGSVVVPMAGMGQRFAHEGYTITKPLIPVSGKPMVLQATDDLPPAKRHSFVLRSDMPGYADIAAQLNHRYPHSVITTVAEVTQGQACTARLGVDALGDAPGPITIGACDNGAMYDAVAFEELMGDPQVDVVVWGVRGHANAVRQPAMFGWIDADAKGRISNISVKTPLVSPTTDPIVLGTFTFCRAEDFRKAIDSLIARDGRVNGEFYLDSCINDAIAMGLNCYLFEVDSFLSWGTPNDLRTFEYWQSCFHKWSGHPYLLENDRRVAPAAISGLEATYQVIIPVISEPRA